MFVLFSSYCSENKVATLMILPLYIVASNYTVLSLKLAIFHQTRWKGYLTVHYECTYQMKQLDVPFIWLGKTLPVSGMNMYSG